MWRILSLSALLIVAHTADINDIYGGWVQAAFYPVSTYAPVCIRYAFIKGPENVQCTCGVSNVTSVQIYLETHSEIIPGGTAPLLVVENADEVMPALNVSCKCGDKDVKHTVARVLNKDYFIMYQNIPESMASTRTEIEQNSAFLFGKNVVSESALADVMMGIQELKKRRGAMMCVTENFKGFVTDSNKL